MIQLFHVLVHEYLHDTNHSKNHVHSFEFYEAFHNVMLRSDYMTSIQADIKKSAIAYGEKLVRNGFSLSRSYCSGLIKCAFFIKIRIILNT